ncbi:MAG: hypothetical protein F8N37_21470 [Telmatospirillum sp.]|nr:hypothetical protein [Telmatospirillum sp.]
MSFHRHRAGLLVLAFILAVTGAAHAADPVKKKPRDWTPGYDDPSIGSLGAPQKAPGAKPGNRNALPPAPVAAPALPKVDAGAASVSGLNGAVINPSGAPSPSPSPSGVVNPDQAAPRPEVQGGGLSNGSGTPVLRGDMPQSSVLSPGAAAQPQQVNTFLATHLVISGLIAGLIGTDLGSLLYGGPMMGDETAAMVGFIIRIALVILVAVLAVRLIWGLIGGSKEDADPYAVPAGRREPSFERSEGEFEGRREPTLGGYRPGRDDAPLRPRR